MTTNDAGGRAGRSVRPASIAGRLVAATVLACFAYLVWLASTGAFDREVGQLARALRALAD